MSATTIPSLQRLLFLEHHSINILRHLLATYPPPILLTPFNNYDDIYIIHFHMLNYSPQCLYHCGLSWRFDQLTHQTSSYFFAFGSFPAMMAVFFYWAWWVKDKNSSHLQIKKFHSQGYWIRQTSEEGQIIKRPKGYVKSNKITETGPNE